MTFLKCVLLIGAVSGLCQAGVLGLRQAPAQSCSPVTHWNPVTITKTETVTNIPPTVTILQQDPDAVASSMASVDTAQVSIESVEAPVSAAPLGPQTFTHSVKVSGYEATEISNSLGSSVFYLSKAPVSTGSGSASPSSVVAGVLTVTVLPLPVTNSFQQNVQQNTSATTNTSSSGPTGFASPYGGWNGTASTASSFIWSIPTSTGTNPGAIGSYGSVAPFTSATDVQPTFTGSTWTSTVTEVATLYATLPMTSAPAFESSVYGYGSSEPAGGNLEKRQTCTWVSAIISGQSAGWCNNWDGHSTLPYTSWETTVYPSYIPGIGTITKESTSTSDSITGSVTIQTSTNVPEASSAALTATNCGVSGPFEVGFDNLPPSGSDPSYPIPPFIENPYNYLIWGDGWGYAPPPNVPFPPQSGNLLAQFDPSINNTVMGSPDAGSIPPGSIGALNRNDAHYWFNANSAWVGCDNGSQNLSITCDFVATAYQWDNYTQTENVVATQHFHIPPCPDYVKCQLAPINFNYLFYRMSTVQFYAVVQGHISKFWMDSIDLNWYDNSCEAGLARVEGQW